MQKFVTFQSLTSHLGNAMHLKVIDLWLLDLVDDVRLAVVLASAHVSRASQGHWLFVAVSRN